MKEMLHAQYHLTRDARSVLLAYCATIPQEYFVRSHPEVGNGGSIRNLLVHINNSYHGWLSRFALKEPFQKRVYTDLISLKECEGYFDLTNSLVNRFLDQFDNAYDQPLENDLNGKVYQASPLKLFTHVVTHEFHHKGQILVLGRTWGYEPVDTDILR